MGSLDESHGLGWLGWALWSLAAHLCCVVSMALLTLLEVGSLAGLRGPQLDLLILAPNGLSCSRRLAWASSLGSPRVPKSSKRGLALLKSWFESHFLMFHWPNPDSKEWKERLYCLMKRNRELHCKADWRKGQEEALRTFYSQLHLLELETMRYRDHPEWPRQKSIVDMNKVSPFSTAIDPLLVHLEEGLGIWVLINLSRPVLVYAPFYLTNHFKRLMCPYNILPGPTSLFSLPPISNPYCIQRKSSKILFLSKKVMFPTFYTLVGHEVEWLTLRL